MYNGYYLRKMPPLDRLL